MAPTGGKAKASAKAGAGEEARAPSAVDEAFGDESRLLAEASAALNRGETERAMERLDRLGQRFPRGALRDEADLLRVAALQRLGRSVQLLALLERLSLAGQARRLELTVLRGELRAQAGRCAAAVSDFDGLLGGATGAPPAGAVAERALHGRAGCRLRLGQSAAGRAYLARFPDGPRAAEVRRRLDAFTPQGKTRP